ncbi:MAG: type IV pilus twitching motility protein PilT [Clostridia bacterium]|nr:type IV pilus twitching motility protein PilT [Clostridia bacterium]
MHIDELLSIVEEQQASDLHITVSSPPMMRRHGRLLPIGEEIVTWKAARELARQIAPDEKFLELEEMGECDFSYTAPSGTRFRVNAYKQRGFHGIAARLIVPEIPRPGSLGLPNVFENLAHKHKGLILITGPTGSGKSTTLASIIDYINTNRNVHIITLEDPIEYVHRNKKSIVNQREIGTDSGSFANALRASLRQDPDVILIGEMRDPETIDIALTAAETGHLVFSTLHTVSAPKTIDRIIGSFPPHRQEQVRIQLAGVLEAVISQQLLPTISGTDRVAIFEVMTRTPAIANLIRDGKIHQLYSSMQTSAQFGMKLMDKALSEACDAGIISYDVAFEYAVDQDSFRKMK